MWKTVKLGDVCILNYGKALDKKDRLENAAIPVYGANGIKTYSNKLLHDKPSIIIGRKGSAGELNKVTEPFWALDVTYYVTTDESIVNLDFLFYTLVALNLPSMARGVKPGINRNDVYDKSINLPSLAEQERIVTKLDAAFAEIDGAVNAAIAKETEVQKLKASLLSSSLTGNAVMWESVKLSDVVTFVRGLTYSKKDEVDANGLAVLRATNVSLEHHKITLDEIRYIKTPVKLNEDKLVKVGDILMCTASGSKSHLGKCALVKEDLGMAFGGFMAALRCKSSCLPEYLFYILTSNLFMKRLSSLSDGANINNLKFSQIEDFEFPLPSLEEQERIVAKLDAAYSEFKNANESILKSKVNYLALKSAILSQELQSSEAA